MYIIPSEGMNLQDPDRRDRVPPEGRDVPATNYWHRRIAEGSARLRTKEEQEDFDKAEAAEREAEETVAAAPKAEPEASLMPNSAAAPAAEVAHQEVAG